MAIDAYLYFPKNNEINVAGETLDSEMSQKKAFELESFGFGANNSIKISSDTGGAGGGKTDFEEFEIKKKTDTASCGLFQMLCLSKHFDEAILELRRAGGSSSKSGATFMKIHFLMVVLSKMTWSGDEDSLSEDITFEYGAIRLEYFQQDKTGKLKKADGDQGEAKWSRTVNENVYRIK
ncbi:Hcp family type VI secretion system effector [Parasulfitobacter algicola]|uniref:Type VI secretion system tube protein Hcp n=1 Tax=Parasulfitobacter algicola TaxID=2614809 RepID=A0ABX2ISB4_9RHOB|nr:type VI secretion system tube protein Hcp [Sulfitobacter algicola]NSX53677.1 type VI secretion system tube protein Hcp [Sulfitobacter algicola]